MTSSLYRSPSLCSATTPNASLDMHEQIVAFRKSHVTSMFLSVLIFHSFQKSHLSPSKPQSAEFNSDVGIQVGSESKLPASSSSNAGNVPLIYEPAETLLPSNAPMSPLLYSLQKHVTVRQFGQGSFMCSVRGSVMAKTIKNYGL
uniref:Rho-GAP domain-containing protein n=1 Tax=Elaeophora elaphi TaxID=1147741 RepID=A0A0R3S252_9BILA